MKLADRACCKSERPTIVGAAIDKEQPPAVEKAVYTNYSRENWFLPMDPNNLVCMSRKWRHGDVSLHTGGDLAAALGRITAKTFVIPFGNDMFFPAQDCAEEQAMIASSELRVVDSLWAHFAMCCLSDADRQAIDDNLKELLDTDVG